MSGQSAPPPAALLRPLFNQFARPSGLLGRLAGRLMAKGVEDDEWLINLLEIKPDDRVLEVGFGPGVAIELIAARATNGLVAGIDPSDVMLREAKRRNRLGVEQGRIDLRQGIVMSLPFPDVSFTKALALHSIYFWPSIELGLKELHRVLRPRGKLAIGVRMYEATAGLLNPSRYGLTIDQVEELRTVLGAGFTDVDIQTRKLGRETIAAILVRR